MYVEVGDESVKNEAIEESETFEKEYRQRAIEAGQTAIKTRACKTVNTGRPISVNVTENYDQQPGQQYQLNESHGNQDDRSRFLKPLKVPTSVPTFLRFLRRLVDELAEPVNLKMARLLQCLTGNALEAIRGLGVTIPEYEEAKEILKSIYGGERGSLRTYMDQLEQMPFIRSNDIHALGEVRRPCANHGRQATGRRKRRRAGRWNSS